jgi:hypothetical protein
MANRGKCHVTAIGRDCRRAASREFAGLDFARILIVV